MKREDVIRIVSELATKTDTKVFVGNGYNARAMCNIKDHKNFFYMVGSMGLSSTLAAGYSFNSISKVIAIEGDGNFLMGMSGLPVVASATKNNTFIHIVLENGVYETTGGQMNLHNRVSFDKVAESCGYSKSYVCEQSNQLKKILEENISSRETIFILAKTYEKSDYLHPRVKYLPVEIKERFINI